MSEGKERLVARVLRYVCAGHDLTRSNVMTQMTQNFNPVIHIQKDSKDDTQWDCSEMVGCVSQRSFELMLQTQPSKNVTVHKFT